MKQCGDTSEFPHLTGSNSSHSAMVPPLTGCSRCSGRPVMGNDTSKLPPVTGCSHRSVTSKLPLPMGCSSHPVMSNEFLLSEVLTWVPVKSLIRFKCVCKQWYSLIHSDREFIDLHFTRSKTCNFAVGGGDISLLISWPRIKVFSSAELLLSEGGVTTVEREIPISGAIRALVIGVVNGLVALADTKTHSVCFFNPSTGHSTPWIKSMIKQQHENLCEEIQVIDEDGDYVTHKIKYANSCWSYFGYDPTTKEHKVVKIWLKLVSNWRGFLHFENTCEVITVDGRGHNNNLVWRLIDDEFSLPPIISPYDFSSSLYANGCIYWLRTGSNSDTEPLVVEFNVGSERFRVISIPGYIIEEIRYPYVSQLIQIDGCLAVLAKKICMDFFGEHPDTTINNNTSMKMCVLCDNGDDDQHKKLTSTISGATTSTSNAGNIGSDSDFHWVEETFMMPPFDWNRTSSDPIQAVPGTDLFIIRSEEEAGSSFYFYDWRKKSFSNDVQFFIRNRGTQFFPSVYKESLLPVMY